MEQGGHATDNPSGRRTQCDWKGVVQMESKVRRKPPMPGDDKPSPPFEIGQGTVVRLSLVGLVVGAVATFFLQLGSIKEQITQISGSGIEKRLTTIEVTNLGIERRLTIIEAEIKMLAAAKRAELRSHLVRPTSAGTADKSLPPPLFQMPELQP